MASARTLSAGVMVIRETADDGMQFLLLRAYRNWDFPKGVVEAGESPLSAAIRETAEETGVGDLQFPWGHAFVETRPYGRNKIARYYLARTRSRHVRLAAHPDTGRAEHHEYRWAGLIEAAALLPPRLQPMLAWAARTIGASLADESAADAQR